MKKGLQIGAREDRCLVQKMAQGQQTNVVIELLNGLAKELSCSIWYVHNSTAIFSV